MEGLVIISPAFIGGGVIVSFSNDSASYGGYTYYKGSFREIRYTDEGYPEYFYGIYRIKN